ncbi:MAG: lipopolysaccharide heptosyltransferase II [Elusimicrobiota bacterium]
MIAGKENLRILIVCWDNIGDVVLATPLIKKWRKSYPQAHIAVLVKDYTQYLLQENPYFDELIVHTPFWAKDYTGLKNGWRDFWRFAKELRQKKFDLAVITNADWRKALLIRLAGISHRLGHQRKMSRFLLTAAISSSEKNKHIVQYHWELSPKFELTVSEDPEIFVPKELDRWVENFWRMKKTLTGTPVLGLHPFAGNISRCWPEENLIELINQLVAQGWEVLIFSHEKESLLAKGIKVNLLASVNWIRNIPFPKILALMRSCDVFLGNDSGLLHCAAALSMPVVGIYGPSDWQRSAPWGDKAKTLRANLECAPCGSDPKCKDLKCLKLISPEEVKQAVLQQIKLSNAGQIRFGV